MERTESKSRIRVNSNTELVDEIRRRLAANGGYCPSVPLVADETKCMCKEFRDMEEGLCRCGLFFKTLNYDD